MNTTRFLVLYDYGEGGLWAWVQDSSKSALQRAFPELHIADHLPRLISREELALLPVLDLAEPSGLLTDVLYFRDCEEKQRKWCGHISFTVLPPTVTSTQPLSEHEPTYRD